MSLLRPSNAAPAAAPATRPRTIRKTTGLFCLRKPTQFSLGVVYTGTNFAGIDAERVATPTARAVLAHRVDASRTSLASVLALLEQRKSIQTLRLPISSSVNSRRASLPNRPREPAPRPPCRHFKIQPCSCLGEGSKKSSSGVRCSTLQQVARPHAPSTHTQHLCGHVYHLPRFTQRARSAPRAALSNVYDARQPTRHGQRRQRDGGWRQREALSGRWRRWG